MGDKMKNVKIRNLKRNIMLRNQTTSELIHDFIYDKRRDNLSENTIRFYKSKLKIFASHCYRFCGDDFSKIDKQTIRTFFEVYSHNHKPSTVASLFNAVNIFYSWYENMVADYIDYENPIKRLKAPRVHPVIHDPISLDDVSKMIEYCNTFKNSVFYKSCLYFLLDTGLRASEFLSLDIDDVNLINGDVDVRVGKGGKRRTVIIGPRTKKALKAYLKTRTDDEPALWISSYGKRLSYSGLNRILKTVAEKAGVEPTSAHDWRRACIKNLILDGTNAYVVQILAGWSSYAVLQKYAKLYSDDIRIAHGQSGVDKWLK